MTPIRAVVFDLDGTLIDSAPSLHRVCADMLAARDLPQPDLATVKTFIGEGVPILVRRCLDWAGSPEDPTALADFHRRYDADPLTGTKCLPRARETLATLHGAGVSLGLCTNKPEAPTRTILDALDLGPFAAIAGGDTLPARKPDPAPLFQVIHRLDATPTTTLYVGDSRTDWRTAAAAGCRYAHVPGGYERETPPTTVWRILHALDDLPAEISS